MIWIGWETGIATELDIPIWILEDITSQIRMPIPSFTDYVIWNSRNKYDERTLRNIIESDIINRNATEPPSFNEAVKMKGKSRNAVNLPHSSEVLF